MRFDPIARFRPQNLLKQLTLHTIYVMSLDNIQIDLSEYTSLLSRRLTIYRLIFQYTHVTLVSKIDLSALSDGNDWRDWSFLSPDNIRDLSIYEIDLSSQSRHGVQVAHGKADKQVSCQVDSTNVLRATCTNCPTCKWLIRTTTYVLYRLVRKYYCTLQNALL